MSFRGQLIKAGIDSNGKDITVFDGYFKLTTDNKLYFRDTGIYMYSNADGYLTFVADTGFIFDGDFTLGDAITDSLIIKGRMSTGTEAGAYIEIDATTYQYTEGVELRYAVVDWADVYTLTSFTGMKFATEARTESAGGQMKVLDCDCRINDVTVGHASSIMAHTYIKGSTAKTVTKVFGGESEVEVANGSGTLTISTALIAHEFRTRISTAVAGANLLKCHGAVIKCGCTDGTTKTVGTGLLIENYSSGGGDVTWTKGLDISDSVTGIDINADTLGIDIGAVATGINITGATTDGIIISGASGDNAIEITGVATGAGILIDYTIAAAATRALHIDMDTSVSSSDVECVEIAYTNTTNGINNMRAFTSTLTMGANCNGPYAGYFRTDIGAKTVGGLSAALGMELILSSVAGANGECHGMTMDFKCPSGSQAGTGTNKHSFIKFEIWDNTTAKNHFDDQFNLFFLNGMTSAAGNLVSADEHTLRVNLEGTSRYLVLSDAENTLAFSLATSGAAAVPTLDFGWTTTTTVGTNADPILGGATWNVDGFLQIGDANAGTNPCSINGIGSHAAIVTNLQIDVADITTNCVQAGLYSIIQHSAAQDEATNVVTGVTSYIKNGDNDLVQNDNYCFRACIYTSDTGETQRQTCFSGTIYDTKASRAQDESIAGLSLQFNIVNRTGTGSANAIVIQNEDAGFVDMDAVIRVCDSTFTYFASFHADGVCDGVPAHADGDITGDADGYIMVMVNAEAKKIQLYN